MQVKPKRLRNASLLVDGIKFRVDSVGMAVTYSHVMGLSTFTLCPVIV